MPKQLELYVHYQNTSVGQIKYDTEEDEFSFHYDPQWIEAQRFQVSPHINYKGHERGVVRRFLENLLPEGKGLNDLSKLVRVPKSNVFALVNSIGRDLSGALEITSLSHPLATSYRKISSSELTERIKNRINEPIATWDGRPRLSVAGVQDKLPVTKKDGSYGLGEGQLASTHLLKFGRQSEQNIVLNEYFCMQLAKASGLNVAETEVINLGERVLEVTRFDRKWQTNETVGRRHVIDACQALDIAPDHKYERFLGDEESVQDVLGPANLENLYKLSDLCINPAKTKLEVLQWVIFNLLIGNSDNHFKNISYFVDDSGMSLAPFYDLLSVTVYPDINHSMAFAVGEAFDPQQVNERELLLMGHELNLNSPFVKRQALQVIKKLKKALSQVVLEDLELDSTESSFLDRLRRHIESTANRYQELVRKL